MPYLWPNSPTVERWRPVAEAIPGFKIGVCWRGDSRNHTDPRRSFKPELLAPLAEIPGVTLLALQLGRDDEIAGLPIHPVPGRETWMDTAAVIAGLDLVIAADTGIAHLAGAMGVPTWIALNDPPDWRYSPRPRGLALVPDRSLVQTEASWSVARGFLPDLRCA